VPSGVRAAEGASRVVLTWRVAAAVASHNGQDREEFVLIGVIEAEHAHDAVSHIDHRVQVVLRDLQSLFGQRPHLGEDLISQNRPHHGFHLLGIVGAEHSGLNAAQNQQHGRGGTDLLLVGGQRTFGRGEPQGAPRRSRCSALPGPEIVLVQIGQVLGRLVLERSTDDDLLCERSLQCCQGSSAAASVKRLAMWIQGTVTGRG
jgi:hypothetical protein